MEVRRYGVAKVINEDWQRGDDGEMKKVDRVREFRHELVEVDLDDSGSGALKIGFGPVGGRMEHVWYASGTWDRMEFKIEEE